MIKGLCPETTVREHLLHTDHVGLCLAVQRSLSPRHRPSVRASSSIRRSDSPSRSQCPKFRPDVEHETGLAKRSGSESRPGSLEGQKHHAYRNSRSQSPPQRRHLSFLSSDRRGYGKHEMRTFSPRRRSPSHPPSHEEDQNYLSSSVLRPKFEKAWD